MLHGSETWPARKENEVALQRAEMRMFRWMCSIKLQDRVPSKELRERLGLDDMISVLQRNRLQWYMHVQQEEDNDWVKKCQTKRLTKDTVWHTGLLSKASKVLPRWAVDMVCSVPAKPSVQSPHG